MAKSRSKKVVKKKVVKPVKPKIVNQDKKIKPLVNKDKKKEKHM